MSALGEEFLAALYHGLLECRFGLGYVMTQGSEVVGFSFGRSSHTHSFLRGAIRARQRLSFPLLKLLCQRPIALLKAMRGLVRSGSAILEPGIGELMSIVVTEAARGGQESQEIANLLFQRLKREGCHAVRWETLGHNMRAQHYYAKIGGRLIKDTRAGRRRILLFEKNLSHYE